MMQPALAIGGSGTGSGERGPRGYSAYDVAVQNGFVGDEAAWLLALEGPAGASAYQIAVAEGFIGSQSEWVETLRGEKGDKGTDGLDGKSVELQKSSTAIQWRQTGGEFADLVPLSEITGPAGSGGGGEGTIVSVNGQTGPAVVLSAADVGAASTDDAVTYDAAGNISGHYIYAGRMSDDGSGNYISDGGGIVIGGPTGVRYRHEGFYSHYDEGSIASYPNVANRANRLALCPSGDPANVVGEDTASLALQHLNGSYEQRFVLVSKKAGEYRIASVATGIGTNFPITVAPGNYRVARFETNGTTTFTSEPLNGGANQNTVVTVRNPAVNQFMRLFGRTNGEFGIEYNSSAGNLEYRVNQIGLGIGGINASRRVSAQVTESAIGAYFATCTAADYSGNAVQVDVGRVSNLAYSFFLARSQSTASPDTEFNLRGDGQAFADLTWNANGADYAELFEWLDGNPDAEDRVGFTVVLDGDKIRLADPGEDVLGVVSGTPSVLGNAAWNAWQGKYVRDAFGRVIKDSDGNPTLNPNFDSGLEYIPRDQRPEWSPVGLTGRLRIHKGQPTGSRWIKLADINPAVEEWLVR